MRLLILPLALFAAPLHAQAFEDVAALDAQVAAVAESARAIDPRVRLARCPEAVTVDPPALGAVAVRCVPLGWRIRVPLVEVTKAETPAEIIIRRGDAVELISSGDGFEVSARGTAIEDGRIGKTIRVKSPTAASAITGIVTAGGAVQINR